VEKEWPVVVIGGGPAGMMAAGTAASRNIRTLLIEKNNKPGRKLLITGKGRCNITNASEIEELIKNIPVNGKFLYSAFHNFSAYQLMYFFKKNGLELKVERGRRVFPSSDRAVDVLETLLKYLNKNEVKIKRAEVKGLSRNSAQGFKIYLHNREIRTQKVVLATGGLTYPATGSTGDGYKMAQKFGHRITELSPSLVPLECEENWSSKLDGLKLKNIRLTLFNNKNNELYSDIGELEFKSYGLSGPLVLSASSHIKKDDHHRIEIDLKPGLSVSKLDQRIQRDFLKYSRSYFRNALDDLLPKQIIPVIVSLSQIKDSKTVNQITREERRNLVNLLKALPLTVTGLRSYDEAVITSGGIDTDQVNPGTMESKLVPGLFFAGEILDVDGYTGGFNLQIAFSTGYLAGVNC